tara:strand:- start:510 stop:878 length:369 start_codon:yes stop_codon:yes gene_type:complete
MKREKVYSLVKEILEQRPETRDSDTKLAFLFYRIQHPDFYPTDAPSMRVIEFFANLENGTMIKMSSITRARRLVQQNWPDLRGKKYNTRKYKATKKMKNYVQTQTHNDNVTQEREYHTKKLS